MDDNESFEEVDSFINGDKDQDDDKEGNGAN